MDHKVARIAVFSLAYHPFEGGAEIAAREIMTRNPSYDFCLFTHRFESSWATEETTAGIQITRLGRGQSHKSYYGRTLEKWGYIFRAWRKAEREHRRSPFSLVWAIMASYGGAAAWLFKIRHPSIPFLLTLQEGDAESHILRRVGIWHPIWRYIFKTANQIQAISKFLADFARREGATCPIEIIPNGVAPEEIKINPIQGKKEKIIITTSRLVHKNGIDIALRALGFLERRGITKWIFWILGQGPEENVLMKLAQSEGVGDKAIFMGTVPRETIPGYLSKADIFIRPSRSEGLGNSFLEAMASGVPIIGTPVGGIVDFLKDGITGLCAQTENPESVAEKIQLLLGDQALRKRLAENAAKLVAEKYTWDIIAASMNELFKKCLVLSKQKPR